MNAELQSFITIVAIGAAVAALVWSRSAQKRLPRLESSLAESEHLRLELLRQNSELRLQLDTAIKALAKPTRAPVARAAAQSAEAAPAPTSAAPSNPDPQGGRIAPAPQSERITRAPTWQDTQPYTTAPAPLQASPAPSLIPRLRR